ncbi:hypothetical protein KAH81_08710 [bacterium]|nr:hypothetical protein [bacterium]
MRILFLIIGTIVLCSGISAQTVYGDMTLPAGAFLWLNTSAQYEALGGAATVVGDLKTGGNANPAALFGERTLCAGVSYSYMRSKTFNSNIFFGKTMGNWAGTSRFFLMDSDKIEARSGPTSEPDYTFSSHQLYMQFAVAKRFPNVIDLGTSAKWIHERIDQESREGWVFDFGAVSSYKFVSGGVSLQNLGNEVVFNMFRERYPLTYRAGLAADILGYGTLVADYIKPDRLTGWFALGAEYNITDYAALRVGFTPGHDTRNFSAGFGVRKAGIELDYALVNYSEGLGISHQVTLSYGIPR